ncbi:MAG: hypothetical protein V9H26_03605 [Verrucomicrobiota bacterium]
MKTLKSLKDYFGVYFVAPLWGVSSEDDELFLLQHYQALFESLRKLDRAEDVAGNGCEIESTRLTYLEKRQIASCG